MIRRIVLAGSALVLAGVGIAGTGAVAQAAKPVLNGTLSCHASGFTTISPGIVLNLPVGTKDKGPKFVAQGGSSGCTGSATSGVLPTSVTSTSKSKGTSRALVQPASACSQPARVAKTKITFNTGDKLKVNETTGSSIAFNPVTHVSTPFPPCGSPSSTATTFAFAHLSDRIKVVSTGVSTGKAFPGKTVTSTSVTTQTLGDELALSQTATGVTRLDADPAFSTFTIG